MPWDYLILTASHAAQGRAYRSQLELRRAAGLLPQVRDTLVVDDLDGRRIGSGGSTLECLRVVVNRERIHQPHASPRDLLSRLRVLIVHAGGDSRRLPAYGPCGKIFVPIPGAGAAGLAYTLFDRLIPPFLDLPAPTDPAAGQVVIATGDSLLLFDGSGVVFPGTGMTMLGSPATPDEAARHGVFCLGPESSVRLYLQKPPRAEQEATGAIQPDGQTVLDIGVANLDASGAAALLDAFELRPARCGDLEWTPAMRELLLSAGIDLYREIGCAMGDEATLGHYLRAARAAGSKWTETALSSLFPRLRAIPFHARVVPGCTFLHFGATRQLIESGAALAGNTALTLNSSGPPAGGSDYWVEGCRLAAPLTLAGRNAVIGVDVEAPVSLPAGAAIDITPGDGVHYIRCYGIDDSFKDATFCGRPLADWLAAAGAAPEDVWTDHDAERTLWTARLFPAESDPAAWTRWLWMFRPEAAASHQQRAWREAPRVSAAEIVLLADQDSFHARRTAILKGSPC